ncbi:hypothetical protein BESB_046150 [Besnoitia besnoiti]|uniref:Transmembrane protein n=1 Tax=Besnoitia besnoiti TaxID=94643 RepID=A0A2A9ML61_BESBE|nr:hypothetical protein BESB_046150 [Besnoitia besnoiti]PFH36423.1 hypothetical protein BESB_046150 [Besnoitia besnoiti]
MIGVMKLPGILAALFLLCGALVRAHRVSPAQQDDVTVLESPLFNPLSSIAYHVLKVAEGLPRAQRQAFNDESLTKLLQTFEVRTNRLKPLVENVFLLMSKKERTKSDLEMFQSGIEAIESIFSQLHRSGKEIESLEDKTSSHRLCESILLHVQQGLPEARALRTANLNSSEALPSVVQDFVAAEYLPNAERVYSLNQKLQNAHSDDGIPKSSADELLGDWQRAHAGIQRSGRKILALIAKVKNSIPRVPSPDDFETLAAAIHFMQKDVADDVKTHNWETLRRRLDAAQKRALTLLHNTRPPTTKPHKIEGLDLPMVTDVIAVGLCNDKTRVFRVLA